MRRHNKNNSKRLGNVDTLTVEQLREKIRRAKEALDANPEPETKQMLEDGIAIAQARIQELESTGGKSAPKKTTPKPKNTQKNTEAECENLKQENEALKKQLREKGITPKAQRSSTGAKKRAKGIPVENKTKKNATANEPNTQKPKTKQTKTVQQGGKGKGKNPSTKQGGDNTQAPKTRQVSQRQIEAKAKREAKVEQQKVKQEAKNADINEKVATKFVEYNVVQSAVRKILRYKDKPMSYTTANNFYNDILLANKASKFNKETPAFAQVEKIFKKLEDNINSPTFQKNKGGMIEFAQADWKIFEEIAEVDKGFLTVKYANEFINISKTANEEKAKALVKKIQQAEKRLAVSPQTPFYKEMKEAEKKALQGEFVKYSNALKGIPSKKRGLSGLLGTLKGIGLGCTCENYAEKIAGAEEENAGKSQASYPEADSEAQTMTIDEIRNKEYDYYEFDDKWCKLFDAPATNFKFMFFGEPGSGKTALSMQFAEYLAAQHGLKVLYVTAEEFDSKSFQDKVVLNGLEDNNVIVANREFREMDLSAFDVIFIDSVQRLQMTPIEFDELVKIYPEKAFVLLFQMTKSGQYKGAKDWEHNLDGNVEVNKKNHTATAYKRYTTNGGDNLKIY